VPESIEQFHGGQVGGIDVQGLAAAPFGETHVADVLAFKGAAVEFFGGGVVQVRVVEGGLRSGIVGTDCGLAETGSRFVPAWLGLVA